MMKNNLWTEAARFMIELNNILSLSTSLIPHVRNDDIYGYKWTPYYIITFVQLFHIRQVRNTNICGTEQSFQEFTYNSVLLQLF